MTTYRMIGAIAGAAMFAALTIPASAQLRPGLADFNKASESELAQLPGMTPALAKGLVEHRPFKSPLDLNKFLVDQKLTADQVKALYGKAFVPINLNTGARDEFLLIPGVGSRMSAEFMEYRPWKSWTPSATSRWLG